MMTFSKEMKGFTESLRLYRETLEKKACQQETSGFLYAFEHLLREASELIEAKAVFSHYGLLRGFCESVVMFECLLEHENEGSFEYYASYRGKVQSYFHTLDQGRTHPENDRPHQYDWYNGMKRGGFTTSKVSLKTLSNEANKPLLKAFHILNVKIHNAEFLLTHLKDGRSKNKEIENLKDTYLLVLNHILRILRLYVDTPSTKPILDSLLGKRNQMALMGEQKEKNLP